MTDAKRRRAFPYRVILSALMGVVLLYLAVTSVMQTSARLELRDKLGRLEQEIETAKQENAALKDRLEYVSSNDAAEEWARQNGWAMQDEVLVVVLAPEAEGSPGDESQQEEVTPVSNRDSWWNLFFGER